MKEITNLIDQRLEIMAQEKYAMMSPDPKMPTEMQNTSIEPEDDWKSWQPIPSTVQYSDINELEDVIGFELPESYKTILRYKHFYELHLENSSVILFPHVPTQWKKETLERLNWDYCSELIQNKFYHFANLDDWGWICFNANNASSGNEYEIVIIDHEDTSEHHFFAKNLKEVLESNYNLTDQFIQQLNKMRGH